MSTMKDVARVAGVSIATVSRVLAGTAAVTDSTQKKVLAAMEELQYRTAAPVRPVIRKESQLTAVCMENLTSPYYIDLLRGVEDVLSISNCSPLLFNLDNDDRAFAELTQALLSFRVASVLFIGCGDILSRADLEQFPELPAVILAENTPSVPCLSRSWPATLPPPALWPRRHCQRRAERCCTFPPWGAQHRRKTRYFRNLNGRWQHKTA